jgi:tetratricopeptide (TPR) repeat protein
MRAARDTLSEAASQDAEARLDLLERFDMAWRGGAAPTLDEFLDSPGAGPASSDPAIRRHLLGELIKIDLEYRWRRGRAPGLSDVDERPLLDSYLARHPELGTPESLPLDLIAQEYRVRRLWGDRPSHDEYLSRFPEQAARITRVLDEVDQELSLEQTIHDGVEPMDSREAPGAEGPPMPRLGRFELGVMLGRGSFGTVWAAWDTVLRREVALKVPREGRFSGPEALERFLREARATAGLHHPAIVSVYDVGREGETVYIVAERGAGESLDRRIGRARLSHHEAAELVAQVAVALDYAHSRGIIHRDLKPSNILLNGAGPGISARIMDFGLAKSEAGEVTLTLDGQVLGTPAYMSPEQIRDSHAVDGRSDLYSLGVILYELVTGELPFRGATRMLLSRVQGEEPPRPRSLDDTIPRDLETITLRCLAKEPSQRYAGAASLGEDLRRWLRGEPIHARPIGRLERLRNRCRRHPVATALAAMLVGTVVVGFVSVLFQWRRAEAQRSLADESFQDAFRAVDLYLNRIAEDGRLRRSGLGPLRKDLLEAGLPFYRRLIERRAGDPSLKAELAAAHARVGRIHAAIGSQGQAVESYRTAITILREVVRDQPTEASPRRELASALGNLGILQWKAGGISEALASLGEARDLYEALTSVEDRRALAGVFGKIGNVQAATGRTAEALASFARAEERFKALDSPADRAGMANTYCNIGVLYQENEQPLEASAAYTMAVELQEALARDHPEVSSYRSDLANTCNNLGTVRRQLGKPAEALSHYQRARELQEALVKAEPDVAAYRVELAMTMNNLGRLHQKTGRPAEALEYHTWARDLRRALVSANPNDLEARSLLGSSFNNLGLTYMDLGRPVEAVDALRHGIEEQGLAHARAPSVAQYKFYLDLNHLDLAEILRKLDRPAEAAAEATRRSKLWPDDPKQLYNFACELALCIPLAGRDPSLSTAERAEYSDRAMDALRQAVRVGWRNLAHMESDPDLAPLRSRADFQALCRELAETSPSVPPKVAKP